MRSLFVLIFFAVTARAGTVQVPLDHSDPRSRKVALEAGAVQRLQRVFLRRGFESVAFREATAAAEPYRWTD